MIQSMWGQVCTTEMVWIRSRTCWVKTLVDIWGYPTVLNMDILVGWCIEWVRCGACCFSSVNIKNLVEQMCIPIKTALENKELVLGLK